MGIGAENDHRSASENQKLIEHGYEQIFQILQIPTSPSKNTIDQPAQHISTNYRRSSCKVRRCGSNRQQVKSVCLREQGINQTHRHKYLGT